MSIFPALSGFVAGCIVSYWNLSTPKEVEQEQEQKKISVSMSEQLKTFNKKNLRKTVIKKRKYSGGYSNVLRKCLEEKRKNISPC